MRSILILLLLQFSLVVFALDVECDYDFLDQTLTELDLEVVDHIEITRRYACMARQSRSKSMKFLDSLKGKHVENFTNIEVKALSFETMEVPIIPRGIGNHFPYLLSVNVDNVGLSHITSDELKQFPKMTYFSAYANHIKELPSNLFEFNHKLKIINFAENSIESIGAYFVMHIPRLEIALFTNNRCVNENFHVRDRYRKMMRSLESLSRQLIVLCPPTSEMIAIDENTPNQDDRFVSMLTPNERKQRKELSVYYDEDFCLKLASYDEYAECMTHLRKMFVDCENLATVKEYVQCVTFYEERCANVETYDDYLECQQSKDYKNYYDEHSKEFQKCLEVDNYYEFLDCMKADDTPRSTQNCENSETYEEFVECSKLKVSNKFEMICEMLKNYEDYVECTKYAAAKENAVLTTTAAPTKEIMKRPYFDKETLFFRA